MEPYLELLGGEAVVVRWLSVGFLVAARVFPLTTLAPWLGAKAAPTILRTAVGLALTCALVPLAMTRAPELPASIAALSLLAFREALVGAVFAIATSMALLGIDWSGRLVDTWRGASMSEILAPPTGERTSALGALGLMMATAIFVALGGHRVALTAFAHGLLDVPVGTVDEAGGLDTVALGSARIVGDALAFALSLSAPAAVAILTTELALGLVARAAPQVPVFFAGMPLRAAMGLAATLLALSWIVAALPEAFRASIEQATALIRAF